MLEDAARRAAFSTALRGDARRYGIEGRKTQSLSGRGARCAPAGLWWKGGGPMWASAPTVPSFDRRKEKPMPILPKRTRAFGLRDAAAPAGIKKSAERGRGPMWASAPTRVMTLTNKRKAHAIPKRTGSLGPEDDLTSSAGVNPAARFGLRPNARLDGASAGMLPRPAAGHERPRQRGRYCPIMTFDESGKAHAPCR